MENLRNMSKTNDKSNAYGESDAVSADRTQGPFRVEGIGRRISSVAETIGTRKSAADVARVSVDSLQRYIRDDNMPPFDVAARLCLAAGMRMEWLATGLGEPSEQVAQVAPAQGSQALRREDLMMALQLASEALGNKVLPPDKHAELVTLLYELLEEGLPEAKVLRFARHAVSA